MYRIELINKGEPDLLIFSSIHPVEELALINPTLELESGKAGTLTFSVPEENQAYYNLIPMKSEVVVYKKDEEVWRGRVINPETDFYNQKSIEVEGELGYLNDTFQPQVEYKTESLRVFLDSVLTIHNQKVATKVGDIWIPKDYEPFNKVFQIGFVDNVDASLDAIYRNTNYENTYDILKKTAEDNKLTMVVRRQKRDDGVIIRYIDFVKDFNNVSNQPIIFGSNMLDYDQSFKMDKLCTVCMPIGAKINDNMAGNELGFIDLLPKKPTASDPADAYWVNALSSDGLPLAIENETIRRLGYIKLSDYDIRPGDKIFFTTTVESSNPNYDDPLRDGIYSILSWDGVNFGEDGKPIFNIVTHKSVSNSHSKEDYKPSVESFKKEGITVPESPNLYFFVAGMHREDEGEYKLTIYQQKKTSERLDEYFTIENYKDISEDSEDYEGVTHKIGDPYIINPTLLNMYGWIEKKVEYGDLEAQEQLYTKSKEYMTTTQFEQMVLELTALDLSILDANEEAIWINMRVPVYSPVHGITDNNFTLPCTKMSIDFANPENNKYTLGYDSDQDMSSVAQSFNSTIKTSLDQLPTVSATLQSMRENATNALDAFAKDGTVIFEREGGVIKQVYIYNNNNPDMATGRWVWNYGGLGFQKKENGIWQNVEVAMTNSGEIVANKIGAGALNADLMIGGELTLGQKTKDGETLPGKFVVKDKHDEVMAEISKDKAFYSRGGQSWIRFQDASIYGGMYYDKTKDPNPNTYVYEMGEAQERVDTTGRIVFNMGYSGTKCGIDIASYTVGINAQEVWVSQNGFYGGTARIAYSGSVDVVTNISSTSATITEFIFDKGFFIGTGADREVSLGGE